MLKKLLILLVTVTIIFGAYEYYKIRVKGYPVKTYLLSNQYRLLPVLIRGRTNTHIHFSRSQKSQLYFYQIEDLHRISQLQVKLYPIKSQLNTSLNASYLGTDDKNSHIAQTLALHSQIIAELEELQLQLDLSPSEIKKRSITREIDRLIIRLQQLEISLNRYGVDYRPYSNKKNKGLFNRLINLIEKVANRSGKPLE